MTGGDFLRGVRRYLVTGLIIWLPLLATVLVVRFLVRLMDRTLVVIPPAWRPEELLGFSIPGLGVVLAFLILLLTGLLGIVVDVRSGERRTENRGAADADGPAEMIIRPAIVGGQLGGEAARGRPTRAGLQEDVGRPGCAAVIVILLLLLPFARKLYAMLAEPLTAVLPEGSSMIAIDVASPFLTPFKLALLLALILAIPFVLYQLWAFVAPALYREEKRLARPLLYTSVLLFYAGCAFAYFVVFPLVFGFFTSVAPVGVTVMTDISKYLDFVITLFLAFGIAFEVPIATIILVATGMVSIDQLKKARAYVLVGAFAMGMLLTPPDVISQTLLALPMWLLFEIGILMSRILLPHRRTAPGEAGDQASS